MIRKIILLLSITASAFIGYAQRSYNEQVQAYIEKFKDLAIEEQRRTGVPASIKLAQGIFETGAGSSELCQNAQNHFGIKCKSTWSGETYAYTDDARDECFRKYPSSLHSYKDHSDFLKNNKRYSSLFNLSPTDYSGWAYGLKRCGYATNPSYAKKIIKTIEDFNLQEYTYVAMSDKGTEILLASAGNTPLPQVRRTKNQASGEYIPNDQDVHKEEPDMPEQADDEIMVSKAALTADDAVKTGVVVNYYESTSKNGLKGFYARKGDMLLEYAIKNKIRYAKLLEYNDLPDAPLEADMFIYLERKPRTGNKDQHVVTQGETLLQISQHEGIQLQQLRAFNHLEKGEEPVAGTVLQLRNPADNKPQVYATRGQQTNVAVTGRAYTSSNADNEKNYVATERSKKYTNEAVVEYRKEEGAKAGTAKVERVNIADEPAVEETMTQTRAPQQQQDTKEMTPLEKLKAHMDKTVYASDREFEPKSSKQYTEQESVTTVPAANTVQQSNTPRQPSPATHPKAASRASTHTVKKGETLFSIANRYNITVSQLQKMNKLGSAKKIVPGMKLKVKP